MQKVPKKQKKKKKGKIDCKQRKNNKKSFKGNIDVKKKLNKSERKRKKAIQGRQLPKYAAAYCMLK